MTMKMLERVAQSPNCVRSETTRKREWFWIRTFFRATKRRQSRNDLPRNEAELRVSQNGKVQYDSPRLPHGDM
jgi:hypothetical protein